METCLDVGLSKMCSLGPIETLSQVQHDGRVRKVVPWWGHVNPLYKGASEVHSGIFVDAFCNAHYCRDALCGCSGLLQGVLAGGNGEIPRVSVSLISIQRI